MGRYLLTYYGGTFPVTEEERASSRATWRAWLDGLGDAVIDRGGLVMPATIVHPDGSVRDDDLGGLTGYSIIEADALEAALQVVQGCPHLATGGTVAVQELVGA